MTWTLRGSPSPGLSSASLSTIATSGLIRRTELTVLVRVEFFQVAVEGVGEDLLDAVAAGEDVVAGFGDEIGVGGVERGDGLGIVLVPGRVERLGAIADGLLEVSRRR